jgi:hypothetical protein
VKMVAGLTPASLASPCESTEGSRDRQTVRGASIPREDNRRQANFFGEASEDGNPSSAMS